MIDIIKDELVIYILFVIFICRDVGGDIGEGDKKERVLRKIKEEEVLVLIIRIGGVYIFFVRLRVM